LLMHAADAMRLGPKLLVVLYLHEHAQPSVSTHVYKGVKGKAKARLKAVCLPCCPTTHTSATCYTTQHCSCQLNLLGANQQDRLPAAEAHACVRHLCSCSEPVQLPPRLAVRRLSRAAPTAPCCPAGGTCCASASCSCRQGCE
jgi:hypothetical protein